VTGWTGTLPATGHPCLGYCVNRPAQLTRRREWSGDSVVGTIRPRQFHLIPGNEPTEWQRHGSSDMLTVHVRQDLVDRVASDLLSRSVKNYSVDLPLGATDPLLEQMVLAALSTLRRPEDGSSVLYVDSLAYMLATHLVHTYGAVPTVASEHEPVLTGPGVRRIPDLVEAHLAEDLSVDVLAREAGLAPRAFARAFRRQFGTPVHQYVLERRLEKAKELLAATDESIVEIALRTGFSSQSHLATAFRKLTGFTPKQYRKSSAGKAAIIASSAGKAGRGLSTSGEAGHAKTAGASGR
jgi:AraC family transcriptional regulator